MTYNLPSSVGDDFTDVCDDPACVVCSCWPRPGESETAWVARLRAIVKADKYVRPEPMP